jgi:hypothetical protein
MGTESPAQHAISRAVTFKLRQYRTAVQIAARVDRIIKDSENLGTLKSPASSPLSPASVPGASKASRLRGMPEAYRELLPLDRHPTLDALGARCEPLHAFRGTSPVGYDLSTKVRACVSPCG